GAPNTCGTPPAARTPSQPLRASRSRCALHGVISLKSDATPTTGESKSASVNPTARSIARFGARPGPPVVVRLRRPAPAGSDIAQPSHRPPTGDRQAKAPRAIRGGVIRSGGVSGYANGAEFWVRKKGRQKQKNRWSGLQRSGT